MDLNIENLIMMYEKALWELKDTNKCFNITDEESQIEVLTKPLQGEKRQELRIIFEEICFVSKLLPDEVEKYVKDRVFYRKEDVHNISDDENIFLTHICKLHCLVKGPDGKMR